MKPIRSLIVAAGSNRAIGKDNQLLWHLPNDLKYFKNTTWGMPVIMGRKTYESVNKPLLGRINIVITKQVGWNAAGVFVASSLEAAIRLAEETNCKELFIIGGGTIYDQSMNLADTIYYTRIDAELDADTFFPEIDPLQWELVSNDSHPADEKHKFAYHFERWQRIHTSSK